jgi:hypothetical protein
MAAGPRGARSRTELKARGMIGVIAAPTEHDVVREFFELFKTPWEFYRRDRRYKILLCTGNGEFNTNAELVVLYSGRSVNFDSELRRKTHRAPKHSILSYQTHRIPIYGDSITFPEEERGLLIDEHSQECAAYIDQSGGAIVARIGYDLFGEIRTLLSKGQPPVNANIPTLELQIAFLRDLITGCGFSLAEIPPVPSGYAFMACLTHDVDHPSIRQHKWDHTVLGFLYRAVFGSLRNAIGRRIAFRDLRRNWAAALKLPFVYLGLAKDFWRDFDVRYRELEKGLTSTFFLIPFKNYPGQRPSGPAPIFRASRYQAQDLTDTIERLIAAGSEVGLHGIDAWLDSSRGREELDQIRSLTGAAEIGVRMHWLYYDQQSPAALEEAGAAYDSTIGYNETIGYRAGTTQVYKPFGARQLFELPLHVMDTALFYPDRLGLQASQASERLSQLAEDAARFGGCLTINWHDRSIAPERLWDGVYRELVQDLKDRGAWFCTARQAVSWFRKRRAAVFEMDCSESAVVRSKIAADESTSVPGLRLRMHKARALGTRDSQDYLDCALAESIDTAVSSEAAR